MLRLRSRQAACCAAAIALLWARAGYAQQEKPAKPSGSYVDGVRVENYVYEPKFISAPDLKRPIDDEEFEDQMSGAHSRDRAFRHRGWGGGGGRRARARYADAICAGPRRHGGIRRQAHMLCL